MLDPAIQTFLNERKEGWLKKKITAKITPDEEQSLLQEANQLFELATWLPDAAKRAKQLSLVSHPAKFTHPSAKSSSIIAQAKKQNDGFLRTGNTSEQLDVFGNAAAMDVYKFLTLSLADGQSVLAHLEQGSEWIQQQFTLPNASYDELAKDLLAIKTSDTSQASTSDLLKQVYFPIDQTDYHLLSLLTPSSLMFSLKQRIDTIRFSEESKAAREAKKEEKSHPTGFAEIYQLSEIGFGGKGATKWLNISVLNYKNRGKAYLLESMPPILKKRYIQPPRKNFFSDSLNPRDFKADFDELHKVLKDDLNNIHIRNKRDYLLRCIIYQVADQLWKIRTLDSGWSDSERYQALPSYQKTWLDQQFAETRTQDTAWFDEIKNELARWLMLSYGKVIGDTALPIEDSSHKSYFIDIIEDCEATLL